MIFDLKLSGGFWNTINREARHINIVLAAGEIQARFVSKKGANYQTKMVSGMALELPKFDRVEIKSDKDQQIKVWVSDVPLTYAPDTSRTVGSNAVISERGEVYSGNAEILLPAEAGRNKITIAPAGDILVGGVNLNTKNGIPVKAGETFTFNTQGAVYGMETSGAYPPQITAEISFNDDSQAFSPIAVDSTSLISCKMAWFDESINAYHVVQSNTSVKVIDADSFELLSSYSMVSGNSYPDQIEKIGDVIYFTHDQNGKTLVGFNYKSRVLVSSSTPEKGFGSPVVTYSNGRFWSVSIPVNNALPVSGEYETAISYSDDMGETWVSHMVTGADLGGIALSAGKKPAIDVDADGLVLIGTDAGVFRATDTTATAFEKINDFGVTDFLKVDVSNNYIYAKRSGSSSSKIIRSKNGGQLFTEIMDLSNNFGFAELKGGVLVASSFAKLGYFTESQGVKYFDGKPNSQDQGYISKVMENGRIIYSNRYTAWELRGQRKLVGGMPVAIMAEVN